MLVEMGREGVSYLYAKQQLVDRVVSIGVINKELLLYICEKLF